MDFLNSKSRDGGAGGKLEIGGHAIVKISTLP